MKGQQWAMSGQQWAIVGNSGQQWKNQSNLQERRQLVLDMKGHYQNEVSLAGTTPLYRSLIVLMFHPTENPETYILTPEKKLKRLTPEFIFHIEIRSFII